MFALYDEAVAEAKSKALTLANGERDGLTLRGADAWIYIHCAQMGKITGFPNSFSSSTHFGASAIKSQKLPGVIWTPAMRKQSTAY